MHKRSSSDSCSLQFELISLLDHDPTGSQDRFVSSMFVSDRQVK